MVFPFEIRRHCWLLENLVLVLVSGFPSSAESSADCPSACFCNLPSRIVYCSRRGLTSIPAGIAADTLQLNLNANGFHSTVLQRANFTGYDSLEHLYLSECGVERIEVGTFALLRSLKWLDLSNNRIRTLGPDALGGLDLQHLFLNGNRHIRLVPESFRGLVTTGLYLHDCSLVHLAPEVLGPLNASLRYLWLNGNEIDRFEGQFAGVFASLQHLRLASNPLHCNCEVLWLKEFFDRGPDVFKGAVAPSCLTPHRLRGKFFNQLSLFDFRCQSPMFNNIETTFGRSTGRLKCTASGDPAPVLYWIQPSGKTSKYGPAPDEEETRKTEGVLILRNDDGSSNLFGMYICIANNDAGNVTLTINVSWPLLSNESPPGLLPSYFPSSEKDVDSVPIPSSEGSLVPWWQQRSVSIPSHPSSSSSSSQPAVLEAPTGNEGGAGWTQPSSSSSSSSSPWVRASHSPATAGQQLTNYSIVGQVDLRSGLPSSKSRLFTVTELVCAVVGTHLATLALCAVALPVYYRARWWRRTRSTAVRKKNNGPLPQHQGRQDGSGTSRPPPPPPLPQHQQLLHASSPQHDDDGHVDRSGRHVMTHGGGGGGGEATRLTSSAGGRINSRFLTDYLIDSGSYR